MSPEEFLAEFGHLVETEGGVAQLRGLIRELAATGNLSSAPCDDVTLGDVALDLKNGISKRSGKSGEPTPVLRLADIKGGEIFTESLREIVLTESEKAQYAVEADDVLIIRVNGSADLVGSFIPCRTSLGHAYSDHLIRLRLDRNKALPQFVCVVAGSTHAREHIVGKTVSTAGQKTVNQKGLSSLPFRLPPLPEQKRIVEKVDQLMALCDELEAGQKEKREKAVSFNKAALNAVVYAPDKSKLKSSWSRVQDHFEVLYELPENVKELRQTILQLAVMGKLVRQEETQGGSGVERSAIPNHHCPPGWQKASLGERFEIVRGSSPRPKGDPRFFSNAETAYPWIRISDFPRGRLFEPLSTTKEYLTREGTQHSRLITPNDLLVAASGNVGRPCLVDITGYFYDGLMAIRGIEQEATRLFLFIVLKVQQSQFEEDATGIAWQNISTTKLKEFAPAWPPMSEQVRIVQKVKNLMSLCDDLDSKLAQHRDQGQRLMQAVVESLVA